MAATETDDDFKSIFKIARARYAKVWGFEKTRIDILERIEIDRVTAVSATYNPGDMGWRK